MKKEAGLTTMLERYFVVNSVFDLGIFFSQRHRENKKFQFMHKWDRADDAVSPRFRICGVKWTMSSYPGLGSWSRNYRSGNAEWWWLERESAGNQFDALT
jgi:hypothetical protein